MCTPPMSDDALIFTIHATLKVDICPINKVWANEIMYLGQIIHDSLRIDIDMNKQQQKLNIVGNVAFRSCSASSKEVGAICSLFVA